MKYVRINLQKQRWKYQWEIWSRLRAEEEEQHVQQLQEHSRDHSQTVEKLRPWTTLALSIYKNDEKKLESPKIERNINK